MTKTPCIVNEIVNTVSEKLGREAIFRKVNNRDEYFVLDLAFSYFQKADRNRRNDYRSGYAFYRKDNTNFLYFVLANTPIMTAFFKNNFDYNEFQEIIKNTAKFRDDNFMICKIGKGNKKEIIRSKNTSDFLNQLDEIEKSGLLKSVFAKSTTGKTGIGNVFSILIGMGFKEEDVSKIINKSWNLFLWLYPSKPLFKRDASLNRSLQKIIRKCEINKIQNLPKSILKIACSGQIEGAHIKPHKDGGSDKLENGLWLCNQHHRLTEGKLKGNRGKDKIEVKFNSK